MIKIITGIRRCGKSYLLFELFKQSLLENGVDEKHIIQVDLEDRRSKRIREPDALLDHIDSCMTDDGMYYIYWMKSKWFQNLRMCLTAI